MIVYGFCRNSFFFVLMQQNHLFAFLFSIRHIQLTVRALHGFFAFNLSQLHTYFLFLVLKNLAVFERTLSRLLSFRRCKDNAFYNRYNHESTKNTLKIRNKFIVESKWKIWFSIKESILNLFPKKKRKNRISILRFWKCILEIVVKLHFLR